MPHDEEEATRILIQDNPFPYLAALKFMKALISCFLDSLYSLYPGSIIGSNACGL